jgi:uncharacterized membrane-anchored protein
MTWALIALAVAVPASVLLEWYNRRRIRKEEEEWQQQLRK